MNIRNIFQKTEKRELSTTTLDLTNPVLGSMFFNQNGTNTLLSNAAVIRGMSAISSAIASMKINEYKLINGEKFEVETNLEYLLNCQPNSFISAFNFKKNMVENVFNYGNAIIKIERDINNNILELRLLDSNYFTCIYNQVKGTPQFYFMGKVLDMSEYLHIYFYPDKNYGGYFGKSLVKYASSVLNKNRNVEVFQDTFFSSGGINGVLTPRQQDARATSPKKLQEAKDAFLNQANQNLGSFSGVVMLDTDLEYQRISQNAKDSMLLEISEFNVLEVARILNIPGSYLFKDSKEIGEQDQITFYTQTLQPLITLIENELQRKLFFRNEYLIRKIEFQYDSLIKSSLATQADFYTKIFQLGAISPNDICRKLNLPISSEKGSDDRFILQNAQPLKLNLNEVKAGKTVVEDAK